MTPERTEWFVLNTEANVRIDMTAAGLVDAVGEERIFPTLLTAVAAYVDRYTERHGHRPPGLAVPVVPPC